MEQVIRTVVLTPVQEQAFLNLQAGVTQADVVVLRGKTGAGKTTILKKLHADRGGAWLGMREFMRALDTRLPQAMEEAFLQIFDRAMEGHEIVFFDDLDLLGDIFEHY